MKIRTALYRPCPSGQTDNGQKIRTESKQQTDIELDYPDKKEKRTEHGQRCRPMSGVWWSCRYLKIFDLVGKKFEPNQKMLLRNNDGDFMFSFTEPYESLNALFIDYF